MYYLASLLIGILVAVMITVNGGLTAFYGVYSATVIIHVVGLCLIGAIILVRREKPFAKAQPWILYIGGVLGVATTAATNYAFGKISVSAILALGLLGQSVAGALVDQFGLFGMRRHPFRAHQIPGILLVFGGIAWMMGGIVALLPVLAVFGSGMSLVVSRSYNARLADNTSVYISTFFNYVFGLLTAIPVFLFFGVKEPILLGFTLAPHWWTYLGGAIGVITVWLSNVVVVKIPQLYVTLLMFVGQVFTGVLLDALLDGAFSMANIAGGALVALGLALNLLLERRSSRRLTAEYNAAGD
ncbi:MAG: DMT family transporter [Clostridiales bacterium]|nr:DMT family transporter [Clostridiales bacterium]